MKQFFTFLILTLFINYSYAQDAEVIIPSFAFEDAIHVDVFVNVVRCFSDDSEYVNVQIFNESGMKRIVGCDVLLKDTFGNNQSISISPIEIEFMELAASDCKNPLDRKFLFPLSPKIDKKSLDVQVQFNIIE